MGGRILAPEGSFLAPPIFICWKPNRKHTVLGGDTFRRELDHENRALTNGISGLMKDPWELREELTGKTSMFEALGSILNTLAHAHMLLCPHTMSLETSVCLHHVAKSEDGHLCSRKQSHTRHGISWDFNLGLLDLQNCMCTVGTCHGCMCGGQRPALSSSFYSFPPLRLSLSLNLQPFWLHRVRSEPLRSSCLTPPHTAALGIQAHTAISLLYSLGWPSSGWL